MVGHMGYSKIGGFGMGGMFFFSFLFFLLLVALIWLVVSKALVNTRKFKMMKDFPKHRGMHGRHGMMKHKHIKECTCEEDEEEIVIVKKK